MSEIVRRSREEVMQYLKDCKQLGMKEVTISVPADAQPDVYNFEVLGFKLASVSIQKVQYKTMTFKF